LEEPSDPKTAVLSNALEIDTIDFSLLQDDMTYQDTTFFDMEEDTTPISSSEDIELKLLAHCISIPACSLERLTLRAWRRPIQSSRLVL
jgi:hypothetical protein